jgi:hypothetical protein
MYGAHRTWGVGSGIFGWRKLVRPDFICFCVSQFNSRSPSGEGKSIAARSRSASSHAFPPSNRLAKCLLYPLKARLESLLSTGCRVFRGMKVRKSYVKTTACGEGEECRDVKGFLNCLSLRTHVFYNAIIMWQVK